jgi:hypothetical protein
MGGVQVMPQHPVDGKLVPLAGVLVAGSAGGVGA